MWAELMCVSCDALDGECETDSWKISSWTAHATGRSIATKRKQEFQDCIVPKSFKLNHCRFFCPQINTAVKLPIIILDHVCLVHVHSWILWSQYPETSFYPVVDGWEEERITNNFSGPETLAQCSPWLISYFQLSVFDHCKVDSKRC